MYHPKKLIYIHLYVQLCLLVLQFCNDVFQYHHSLSKFIVSHFCNSLDLQDCIEASGFLSSLLYTSHFKYCWFYIHSYVSYIFKVSLPYHV